MRRRNSAPTRTTSGSGEKNRTIASGCHWHNRIAASIRTIDWIEAASYYACLHVGGDTHIIRRTLAELGIDIPTSGMVKDEHHKTRALTDGTHDISIAREQSVFVFVYGLQEEVHRYSVGRMSGAKRKTLTHSVLENVKGIGAAKAKKYMKAAGSLAKLKTASAGELAEFGIPPKDAAAIAAYFAERAERKGN